MTQRKPFIGITMGDAAGVGPEIVAKVAASGLLLSEDIQPILIGDETVLKRGMRDAKVTFSYQKADTIEAACELTGLVLLDTHDLDASTVEVGKVSPVCGKQEGDALVACIEYCKQGLLDAFMFCPLNKAALKAGGYKFPGEHEMFAHYYGIDHGFGELNCLENVWNLRVTSHIPIREVADHLTVENILERLYLGIETVKRAGIENPRIAVAGLNPHAGESGTCGTEEVELIIPAIEKARADGYHVDGPYPSDTVFLRAFAGDYDGVLTMYHDQGQIAVKLKGFEHCITVSGGLPNPIVTPCHGTAYDIAGTGKCRTSSFEDAFHLLCRMAKTDLAAKANA